MPGVTDVVLELGPGFVRRVYPDIAAAPDQETVSAVLNGIDDTVVLLDGHPADVASLWRRVIASVCGPNCESLTVVHPTWWSKPRVDRFIQLAMSFARNTDVVALSRSHLLGGEETDRPVVVIEVDDSFVAISRGAELVTLLDRFTEVERVTDAAMDAGDPLARFVIDVPDALPGGESYAATIRKALSHRGVNVVAMDVGEVAERDFSGRKAEARPGAHLDRGVTATARRLTPRGVVAILVVLMVCGVGVVLARSDLPQSTAGDPDAAGTNLVEGRVVVRIPLHWNIEKITAGPGSRRVRVTSPDDASLALHITQSYAPGVTMGETAEVLQQALELANAVEVFRDFNRDGERAGRPAITYREMRASREIAWSVVVDGSMRIGIGCQSPSGHERDIQAVCDAAVRSASELGGTDPQR